MEELKQGLKILNSYLDKLLIGRKVKEIDLPDIDVEEYQDLSEKFNTLVNNLNEINMLAADLSKGDIDGFIPGRRNYMAGNFKHLQSQLSILAWSMRQLQQGHVVSKMEDTGELYNAFNDLVDEISRSNYDYEIDQDEMQEVNFKWSSVNSWRFHQILTTLNQLKVAIIEVDEGGRILYMNDSAKALLGDLSVLPEYDEIVGDTDILNAISQLSTKDLEFPRNKEVLDKKTNNWYQVTVDHCSFTNGQDFYLHIVDNITDWKKSESRLKETASIDLMTNTLNREAGLEQLDDVLMEDNGQINSAVFIDLNELKLVNDNYGHEEGDYFIKSVTSVLNSSTRESDIVMRYGGDEFAIIFKKCLRDKAEEIMLRTVSEIENLNNTNGKPYTISFSYGIVEFPSDKELDAMDVLNEADVEMYKHKEEYRARRKKEREEDEKKDKYNNIIS